MRRIVINASVSQPFMERYQTFRARFFAGIIDGFLFYPLSLFDGFFSAPERSGLTVVLWNVFLYSSYWIYSVVLHARYGQTVGKMAMKVKVLDVSETRTPGFAQAFLRDIGYILMNSVALAYLVYLFATGRDVRLDETSIAAHVLVWANFGWFIIEVITMSTNQKRRALHDYIARTVVVRTDQPNGVE